MSDKQKTAAVKKPGKKRLRLPWWAKLLLIAATTGLVVFGAWYYCEKMAVPVYTDTVRATAEIDGDTMKQMRSVRSDYVEEHLDIIGNLDKAELNKGSLRGEQAREYKEDSSRLSGIYYYNVRDEVQAAGTTINQFIMAQMFVEIKKADSENNAFEKIVITIQNEVAQSGRNESVRIRQEPEDLRRIVRAAANQFGAMIFGEGASEDKIRYTFFYRGGLKEDADPTAYHDDRGDDYEWIEAKPEDENVGNDFWRIEVLVSKDAVDKLENRYIYFTRALDLVDLLEANFGDEDYRKVAQDAGVSDSAADLRKSVRFSRVGYGDAQVGAEVTLNSDRIEEAKAIAKAAAHRAARVIFRTLLGTAEDAEEVQWWYNSGSLETEAVSKAGGYRQTFYSDRPQYKTDMRLTASAGVLDLMKPVTEKLEDTKSGFFKDIHKSAAVEGAYEVLEADAAAAFRMETDPEDPTGRTLLMHIDEDGALLEKLRAKAEDAYQADVAAADRQLAEKGLTQENYEAQIAMLTETRDRALAVLDGEQSPDVLLRESILSRLDNLFFTLQDDYGALRTVTEKEGGLCYSITDKGMAALRDTCYQGYAGDFSFEAAIEKLKADNAAYERIAALAEADAPTDALKESLIFTPTAGGVTLEVKWTEKTTTQAIGKAALTVLHDLAEDESQGTPFRLVVANDGVAILREQARKSPPATVPTMVIAGLIALVLSYIIFSRQFVVDSLVVIFFVVFTFICVFPFYYLFINTISDNNLVAGGQINFLPKGIHFTNYARILGQQDLGNAIVVTVARTILGTALMVLTSAWAGYLVTKQKMWHRSFWYRALVITMYFNAGLIPWYTNMLMLGLTGNFLAYIIPGMVAPYNIILVKTYIESIPGSLEESAIIDGASTFKVFLRIILPLSVPILATIAIFGAVGNWNSFQDSLLLMSKTPQLYTLQHRLYIYLNQTTAINTEQITEQTAQNLANNGVTTKYTIAMITIIPILLVYPIMQRFFVKGIMLGAVKG